LEGGAGTGGRAGAFQLRYWENSDMKGMAITLVLATVAIAAAGCGHTIEQKAATGAVAGALVAGPVGAAVGGAAGAAVGQAQKPN
jgi:osmotically inducible lipoprotein OsmB